MFGGCIVVQLMPMQDVCFIRFYASHTEIYDHVGEILLTRTQEP